MNNLQQTLYFISSICWQETTKEEVINNNALQKTDYIEVPSNLEGDEVFKFIDHALFESTNVSPWYYNVDIVS